MLIDCVKIASEVASKIKQNKEASEKLSTVTHSLTVAHSNHSFMNDPSQNLRTLLGDLIPETAKHFWCYGNFNMMRLIFWILEQTGPANIIMSTYSISAKTIQGLLNRCDDGRIQEFKIIIDSRVRSLSPKPFEMMVNSFDYRCASIHAKVACIYNDKWKISIVSSQNATDNPKIERGTIYTIPEVFNFDKQALDDIFERSGT